MKFVNEKTTEDFKVRESDNYEAVYDEQFQMGGLIVDGVLFTTLTLDQYKTLAITFKEKGFEDFFNSVGIGDEKLNLQPKAACYSDYERPTGEIQFKENKVEAKKLTKARLKESIEFEEFKKSIVYSVLQDPASLDDCVKSVAERTGLDETNAIDLIDEWMSDSTLTESVLQEGKKIKAAVLGALMAFTGISAASARGLKSADDYSKDLTKVKLELINDYGRAGAIPKEDLQKMVQACSEAEGLTAEQSQEALVGLLGQMGRQNDARAMSKLSLTESESPEYPVFVQINTDEDIDKWMAPIGCDIRSDYDISDVEGSYWEIIADDEDLYRKAIAEGAVTMSELDPETDTFIFLFGSPSRLSIEGFDGYISEMGLDPEDYGVDRCDWYYDNDDAEIQLDEEKLEEANLLKKAIVTLGILTSLGVGSLSAQSLKTKADWNKSTAQCKKELTAEYGKGGTIPRADYKQMIQALKDSDAEDIQQEWEETNGHPVHWFMSYNDCKNSVDSVLEDMGFTVEKPAKECKSDGKQDKLEEGAGWKAALLAGLLAVSGLTGQAFAKDKAPKMTPEQKIEQICKQLPETITGDQFKEFRAAYMEEMGYDAEDRFALVAATSEARDALYKQGIVQEGWHKTSIGWAFSSN